MHGYDYPVADGRGYFGGWWLFPGPWLEPGFRQKGFALKTDRAAITKILIDTFNDMLKRLVAIEQFQHVRYVDLRGTLPIDQSYKTWWDNELHPTRKGYARVAERFAAVL